MINIQGLTKTYASGTQAVNQLNLEVKDGEILALLGPNGAGKSTTIRILTTLAGFDEGKVSVAGFDVDIDPDQVRRSIGYVAQETGVDYFLTGRENMELHGHLYRMSNKDIAQRIEELARYFELSEVLDQQVVGYSGGMRRKLDIATALLHRPKMLFLDEPTLGLDTKSRQSLWKYIEKLNVELGLTILLTTHYLEEADKLSNRVAIINQGQIKIIDTPEALKTAIGGDIVSLSLGNDGHEESLTWALKQAGFVKGSTWENDKLHLYVDNGAEAIPQVMNIATQQNAKVTQISFSRPTLDDVFIKYTGNSINTEAEEEGNKWWEKWAGKGGGGKWAKQWQNQQAESESADQQNNASETEDWRANNKEWQQWQQQKQSHNTDSEQSANDWQQWKKPDDTESSEQKKNHWQPQQGTENKSGEWPRNDSNQNWQQWQTSGTAEEKADTAQKKKNADNWPNQGNWSNDDSSKKD